MHPPKLKFPYLMEIQLYNNLTNNPINLYQAQVADYGETTDKFDIQ